LIPALASCFFYYADTSMFTDFATSQIEGR
jgi:hypothetical protein